MVASSSFLGSWQGWGLKSLMGLEPLGWRNTALPYSGAKGQCSLVVMGLGYDSWLCCVCLGRFLKLSEPRFLYLQKGSSVNSTTPVSGTWVALNS